MFATKVYLALTFIYGRKKSSYLPYKDYTPEYRL